MKRTEELRTTTNNRVYKHFYGLLHKSCPYCKWHPDFYRSYCENGFWKPYYYNEDAITGERCYVRAKWLPSRRFPNWKLVSKNSKQWMKKPLKHVRSARHGYIRVAVEW